MDQFENEVSRMLADRVAGMTEAREIAPELLLRARRRRARKLTALVATLVVVGAGATTAVVQVVGRRSPARVSTSTSTSTAPASTTVPESTTTIPTSTPLTGPVGTTTTSTPASVPTVACPILYAITSEPPLPSPGTEPRVIAGASSAAVANLASYAATTDDRYTVLGPKGWKCHATMAADGQNGLGLSNPALGPPKPYYDSGPIQVLNDYLWHGGVGSAVACSVFDDPAVVQYMTQNFPQLLPCPKAGRTVTRVDANTARFVDADGARGAAVMVLPTGQQDNGKLSLVTCRPAAGLTAADCDTIIADFERRVTPVLLGH